MKKKILALLAGAILMTVTSAMATSITTVTYNATSFSDSGGIVSGAFSGVDANHDGKLSFPELSSWNTTYNGGRSLSSLNDFGTFDYINNIWSPDALQWDRTTHDAYMTWNNWRTSCSTSNYDWVFSTTVENCGAPVPEPSTIFLLGAGLAALGLVRRRAKK